LRLLVLKISRMKFDLQVRHFLLSLTLTVWFVTVITVGWIRANEARKISVTYVIPNFNAVAKLSEDCPSDALSTPFVPLGTSPNDLDVMIRFCFLPVRKEDQSLIPYKLDSAGQVVAGIKYRPEVDQYIEEFARSFTPSSVDIKQLQNEGTSHFWAAWKSQILEITFLLIAGIVLVLVIYKFISSLILRSR
jgi:hypothetical protein